MRREAFFGWSTPLVAALFKVFAALRKVANPFSGEATASRAFFTAVLTVVRTDWLRARRFIDCRFRFSADFVFAT